MRQLDVLSSCGTGLAHAQEKESLGSSTDRAWAEVAELGLGRDKESLGSNTDRALKGVQTACGKERGPFQRGFLDRSWEGSQTKRLGRFP